MSRLGRVLSEVGTHLDKMGLPWALVGGLAVSARTEPRFTRDVDVAVAVADDREAERAVRGLLAAGYCLEATVEQEATGRLATVRLTPPSEESWGVLVDVLFASSGIEPEIVAAAEPVAVLPGVVVGLPRVGHLLAVKLLARDDRHRPQDLADLRALLAVADESEVERAWEAVALMKARGSERGKDLPKELSLLLADVVER